MKIETHKNIIRSKNQQEIEEIKQNQKFGQLSIIGGICINLIVGAQFSWGAFSLYVISYQNLFNKNITPQISPIIAPIVQTFIGIFVQIGLSLSKTIGFPQTICLGAAILIFGQLFSSISTNFIYFIINYSMMFGFGCGLVELLPLFVNARYFPRHKGLTGGMMYGAQGIGGLFSSLLLTNLCNPNNISPMALNGNSTSTDGFQKYFPQSVSDNVPTAIRKMSIIYLILFLIAIFLIKNKPSNLPVVQMEDEKDKIELFSQELFSEIKSHESKQINIQNLEVKLKQAASEQAKNYQEKKLWQRTNLEKIALGKRKINKHELLMEALVIDQVDSDQEYSIITNLDEDNQDFCESPDIRYIKLNDENLIMTPRDRGHNIEDYWQKQDIQEDKAKNIKIKKFYPTQENDERNEDSKSQYSEKQKNNQHKIDKDIQSEHNFQQNDQQQSIRIKFRKFSDEYNNQNIQLLKFDSYVPNNIQLTNQGINNLENLGIKVQLQNVKSIHFEDEEIFNILHSPISHCRKFGLKEVNGGGLNMSTQLLLNPEKHDLILKDQIILPACTSFKDGLKSLNFCNLFFLNYCTTFLGLLLAVNYKLFGFQNQINNDKLLTYIGSLGNLCSGIARIIWGISYDKKGFKFTFLIMIAIQSIILLTIKFISSYQYIYAIYITFSFISFGGVSVIISAQSIQTFGILYGLKLYSIIYYGQILANYSQFLLIYLFESKIGINNIMKILLLPNCLAYFILIFTFTEKYISPETMKYREENSSSIEMDKEEKFKEFY